MSESREMVAKLAEPTRAKGAARRGASADEVADAVGVAVLMDSGPASVYGPRAWHAFHDFSDQATMPVRATG